MSLHVFKEFREPQTRHTKTLTDIIDGRRMVTKRLRTDWARSQSREWQLVAGAAPAAGGGASDDFGLLREK